MNFYIASSFKNINQVKELTARLQSKGFLNSYDWTQNERATSYEALEQIGEQELEAVANSDFLVILLPAGKGSHIEFGIALGLRKRIYVFAPAKEVFNFDVTTTFYHVDGIKRFTGEFEDFIEFLMLKEMAEIQKEMI